MAVTRGIADTSVFIAREVGRSLDVSALPDELAISVITVGELRSGVLAATGVEQRDRRLATLSRAMLLDALPIDVAIAETWARLRASLLESGQRIGVNDSWIAATALALGVPIVTQDRDYDGIPGLGVIRV
ncbi:MAG: type II toxin-antitoxin system VapC family toxin [Actinobacteria bacterium]|nr:type II toxin-antitoxin system VapC family toxin [Actinomycetota bacterium]